jgi:Sulfotransferase family
MGDGILDFRRRHGDDRFVDVPYRRLTEAPLETVRAIYDALGEKLSDEAEAAIREHVGVAVQHRFGKHEYGWDGLGLSRDALDERFSDYRTHFAEYLA